MPRKHYTFLGPCMSCGKECCSYAYGFRWWHYVCSLECMDIAQRKPHKMENPTPHEINAIVDASFKAGEHLDGLGKTDLATMTSDEWMDFIETVISGYVDSMHVKARLFFRENEVPF